MRADPCVIAISPVSPSPLAKSTQYASPARSRRRLQEMGFASRSTHPTRLYKARCALGPRRSGRGACYGLQRRSHDVAVDADTVERHIAAVADLNVSRRLRVGAGADRVLAVVHDREIN